MINKEEIEKVINRIFKDPPIYCIKEDKDDIRKERQDVYYKILTLGLFEIYISKSWEQTYLKNRIKLHFKRECYDVEIKEKEFDNYFKYSIKLKENDKIVVNGNYTLILINDEKNLINKQRFETTSKNQIKHFTDIKSLIKILDSKCFIAKSLESYNTEKGFRISKESGKQTFIACFYGNKNKSKKMWDSFKNTKIIDKVCLEIHLNNNLDELFIDGPFSCLYKNEFGNYIKRDFKISQLNGKSNTNECIKGVSLNKMIRPVQYLDRVENNVNTEIEGKDYTIIDYIARSVKKEFSFQKEVRYIYYLRSGKEVNIDNFNKILLPFNFSGIKKFVIYINKNVDKKKEKELIKIIDKFPISVEIKKIKF